MLTGDTRRAAVLGSPVGHSLSPALHRAAYRALGLNGWLYDAHEVQESALVLRDVNGDVEGADEVSDLACEVGAINTLVRRADGGWNGDNTDVYGVSQALREAGCTHVERSVVLGSGLSASFTGLVCAAPRRIECS